MGTVVYQGIEYQGTHKPLVSKDIFRRVQEVLRIHDKAGERKRKHPHYLKGTIFCGHCGAKLSFTLAKNQYGYFYCLGQKKKTNKSCSQIYVSVETIEKGVENLHKRIQLPKEMSAELTLRFQNQLKDREELNFTQREFTIKRLKKLNNDRQKTLDAYLAGAIPIDLLKSKQAMISQEVSNLESELDKASAELQEKNQIAVIGVKMATSCYFAYQKAKPLQRRLLNQTFFTKIFVKDENISDFERTDLFEDIENLKNDISSISSNNEPLAVSIVQNSNLF